MEYVEQTVKDISNGTDSVVAKADGLVDSVHTISNTHIIPVNNTCSSQKNDVQQLLVGIHLTIINVLIINRQITP